MKNYVQELETWFRQHADPNKATAMEAYMRNQFPFLGMKTPDRNQLMKEFVSNHGVIGGDELLQAVLKLWELPEREFQNVAMGMLEKHKKVADQSHIDMLEKLVTDKSWWDTVDFLAANLIGFHLEKYPDLIPIYTERWIQSDNLWLRRTAIIFQLKYKGRTDTQRLFDYIRLSKDDPDFFIRKAIGWALREYSKTDEASVRNFVEETELSPLSKREALKYVDNRP